MMASKKRRIAIIADPLDTQYAGIHVFTREIILALIQLDQHNEYFIIRPKKGQIQASNVKEVIIPINKSIPLHQRIRQFTSIPKFIKKNKIDIVIEPAHFGPFRLPKSIKAITVIHDLTPLLFPHFHNKMSYYLHKLLLPSILKRADCVITNSEFTRNDVIQKYPFTKDKSKAILLGTNMPQVESVSTPKLMPKDASYFLYMGTLEPRKNLEILLLAYEAFRAKKSINIKLVLAGKIAWGTDDLLEKIKQSVYVKDIILTGFVSEKEKAIWYEKALAFIYPSWYEGFGLPVLEAMSYGVPVLSSNSSSLPEVGGEAVLYFSPDNKDELRKQLEQITTSETLVKELKQLSLKRAKQLTWEKSANELLSTINDL